MFYISPAFDLRQYYSVSLNLDYYNIILFRYEVFQRVYKFELSLNNIKSIVFKTKTFWRISFMVYGEFIFALMRNCYCLKYNYLTGLELNFTLILIFLKTSILLCICKAKRLYSHNDFYQTRFYNLYVTLKVYFNKNRKEYYLWEH